MGRAGRPAPRVDAESDPELLWALRGGGGDLGIVTAVEIDLHPAPHLYGGRLVFPDDAAGDVLDAWLAVTTSAPDELSAWFTRVHMPDAPFLPEEVRGVSLVAVDAVLLGDAALGEELLAPLRSAGPLVRETLRPLRPSELGTVAEEPEVGPGPGVQGRMLMRPVRDLDAALAHRLLAGTGRGDGMTMFGIRQLGGALARPPAPGHEGAGTTVPGEWMVSTMGMAPHRGLTPLSPRA